MENTDLRHKFITAELLLYSILSIARLSEAYRTCSKLLFLF